MFARTRPRPPTIKRHRQKASKSIPNNDALSRSMALPFPYTFIATQTVARYWSSSSSGAATTGLSRWLDFGKVPFHFVQAFGVDLKRLAEPWSSLHLCKWIIGAEARVCGLCTELEVWFGRSEVIRIKRVCRHGRSKIEEGFGEFGIFGWLVISCQCFLSVSLPRTYSSTKFGIPPDIREDVKYE